MSENTIELIPEGDTLEQLIYEVAVESRPLEKLSVIEAAEKYVKINAPGSYVGPFDRKVTPYMVEPTNILTSRQFTGMVFCGPVQSGKTQSFQSWLAYSVKTDPADMLLIQMSQAQASDFSIRRVDKLHRDSPDIGAVLARGATADSMYRKIYRHGMILSITWPSANELASKSIPRVFLTDYDRMPDDVDGEGSAFDLGAKRTTTFRRNAMTAAESTPSKPIKDPKWSPNPKFPHEAPPCDGILGLYNRGDRRRWKWICKSCNDTFEPDFKYMRWPDSKDILEASQASYMACPSCGQVYEHEDKNEMNNEHAAWFIEGQRRLKDGTIVGTPTRSKIASFWLKGPAARFQTWEDMVFEYLTAEDAYQRTGDETGLQTTVNTRQALPYSPKQMENLRLPEDLKSRARDLGDRVVPEDVRFLIATIDVQKNRFVVQVHGIGIGNDKWIIDRFDVRLSNRDDANAPGQKAYVAPHSYLEDWDLLVEQVLLKSYPLVTDPNKHMSIKLTLCDSAGKKGVTAKAYDFYRRLVRPPKDSKIPNGLAKRFLLVAGRPTPRAPRVNITYPDSKRKDRHAGARGEIPVALLNSDILKNELDGALDRVDPHGGRINFPTWLDKNFYVELTVEVKNDKGKWENPNRYRNESWDLLTYCIAGCIQLGTERSNFWAEPPSWAETWDKNDMIFDKNKGSTFVAKRKKINLSELGKKVAGK